MKKTDTKNDSAASMTIKDVAKLAGVSIGTVSRAMNETGYVGDETRKKILKVLEDTGFRPNAAAVSMKIKKSSTVGIIVPEINNPFLSELVVAIEDILSKENLSILLCNSKYRMDKEISFIDDLIRRNAEGLIFVSSELQDEKVLKKIKRNLKTVTIGSKFAGFDCVNFTDWQAAFEMVEYLISLGHRKIACIGSNSISRPTMERLRGYTDALAKNGIIKREEFIFTAQESINTGYARTKQLLELDEFPTAIFAINDFYAINAYIAVREKGLTVGKDISIAGFDDIAMASLVNPSLTTVRCSTAALAEFATGLLLKRIRETVHEDSKEVLLPANLIKRDSTQYYKEV